MNSRQRHSWKVNIVTHQPNRNCAIACCELFLFRDLPLPGKLQQCHSRKMKGVTPCSNNVSNSTVAFFYQGPGTGLTPIEATGNPKSPRSQLAKRRSLREQLLRPSLLSQLANTPTNATVRGKRLDGRNWITSFRTETEARDAISRHPAAL